MSRIQLRKEPRRDKLKYILNVIVFYRQCWPTSIQYLLVNRAAMCHYDVPRTVYVSLPTQFQFNVGPASQPIAGSMPVNRLRCWPNTNPTLGQLYTLRQHISKHTTFTQCRFNVDPQSLTLAQHRYRIG